MSEITTTSQLMLMVTANVIKEGITSRCTDPDHSIAPCLYEWWNVEMEIPMTRDLIVDHEVLAERWVMIKGRADGSKAFNDARRFKDMPEAIRVALEKEIAN